MEKGPLYILEGGILKINFWKIFGNLLSLYIMTNQIIDIYIKNFLTYYHKGWYWVINPMNNEWVVSVGKTGYTFYNNQFWSTFKSIYPLGDLTDNIKGWVIYKLGVPLSKHCYPDYINGEYDWRDEFDEPTVIEVVNDGELVPSHKHDPLLHEGW